MSQVEVRVREGGVCEVEHGPSGERLSTFAAPEFGGPGGGFSSTDLVAAALGTCIGSTLEPVAGRAGIPSDALRVRVTKTLASSPRRIAAFSVEIRVAGALDEVQRKKLRAAAATCAVHRSLSAELEVDVVLVEEVVDA